VLLDAAALRAKYRFRTPDAILLATGIRFSATAAVTIDKKWKEAEAAGLRAFVLSEL
jgi:predicted nucleic acid-binding protein